MREQIVNDRCPSLGDLVLAADGGLSPAHKAEMTEHLRECAECTERLQQANAFLEASAELVDGASSSTSESGVDAEHSPAAAVSYDEEIGAHLDGADKDAARTRDFRQRLHKQKQAVIHRPTPTTAWVRQWLPAAAVIPLLIIGLALPRMQTVVRAEELLKLASNHESSLPVDRVQRVRIRLTPVIAAFAPAGGGDRTRAATPRVVPFLAVRDVNGGAVARGASSGGAGTSGEFAAVDNMLAQSGFDWRQPLSLAGVHAWRMTPGEKHDEVFPGADVLVLRTTASTGPLREVELTVRRHDYHVIKLVLVFKGVGRLEITEIEQLVRAAKATPVTPAAPLASSPVAMTTAPSAAVTSRAVTIDAALSPVTTVVGRAPVSQPGLSLWLDRTFGARPERKAFVPDLQRLVIGVRQNLSALDTLGRRYPEEEVAEQWSGADRAALRRRVDESYRRISRDLNELDARIGILFGSSTRLLPVSEAPADWRQRAALALLHAEAMDGQVRHLLTLSDLPSGDTRGTRDARLIGAAQVPSTFAALWDIVHAPVGGPASR